MGIFSESDSERAVREHNEGQEAGSKADGVDKFAHRVWGSTGYSDAYNKGWEHGVNNPAPKDDYHGEDNDDTYNDDAGNDTSEKFRGSGSSTSSSGYTAGASSSGTSVLSGGGLLLVVIALVGVIILVMNGYNATKERGNNGKEVWVMMGVNAIMLNVRSGPGTESPVIAKFERGARLATTGEPVVKGNEQWVRVSTEDGSVQGWVNLKLLSSSPQLQEIPPVTNENGRLGIKMAKSLAKKMITSHLVVLPTTLQRYLAKNVRN